MSDVLFPEVERVAGYARPSFGDPNAPAPIPWITDQSVLQKIARETCEKRLVAGSARAEVAAFRHRKSVAAWPLANLIPEKVTAEIFAGMVEAAIQGAIDDVRLSQNNGQWDLFAFETVCAPIAGVTYIGLMIDLVDVLGRPDLKYRAGKLVDEADEGDLRSMVKSQPQLLAVMGKILEEMTAARKGVAAPTQEEAPAPTPPEDPLFASASEEDPRQPPAEPTEAAIPGSSRTATVIPPRRRR